MSSFFNLELKEGKLSDVGMEEEDKEFHKLQVFGMNDVFFYSGLC